MKAFYAILVLALLLGFVCPLIAGEQKPAITLMTHDSFAVSEELLKRFEERHGTTLKILKSGDAGAALTQAILSKANPLADVFFGVDNTFLGRALESGIFEPYGSPLLGKISDHLKLDPENRLLPVDFGDVCLNYDKKWFAEKGLRPPTGLEDLVKPEYKGLTVIQNPAT
jgi:thiamine transport system substrate-binding protein